MLSITTALLGNGNFPSKSESRLAVGEGREQPRARGTPSGKILSWGWRGGLLWDFVVRGFPCTTISCLLWGFLFLIPCFGNYDFPNNVSPFGPCGEISSFRYLQDLCLLRGCPLGVSLKLRQSSALLSLLRASLSYFFSSMQRAPVTTLCYILPMHPATDRDVHLL